MKTMNKKILERAQKVKEPEKLGSYATEDCIFLLKNLNGLIEEKNNEEREIAMQSGAHYSEMLPIEYMPKAEYIAVYEKTLKETADEIAYYVGVTAELILKQKGRDTVLLSLARAGTPIGVLIKRYLKYKYQLEVPHYSISIIRDKGIDENAMCYLLAKYKPENLQFVDGWTGKGAIGSTLTKACEDFKIKYDVQLDDTLAVLCDPGECTPLYGTRKDFLVPSACLNATISGLMSRTVLRNDLIGEYDFHGAKYYKEWENIDVSNAFIDTITAAFPHLNITEDDLNNKTVPQYNAAKSVENIRKRYDITSINRVKPGIGETTRVLLRRVTWKIIVKDINDPHLKHILLLAKDRGVPVEEYKQMCYACCGLIKDMREKS